MKAIIKKFPQEGLWMEDVPVPSLADDEVRIRPKVTAICGTDITIYKWGPWAQKNVNVPLVVGHEFMGEIIELGKNVKGLKVGQRVSGEGHIVCGLCRNCRSGEQHLCGKTRGIGYHLPGVFAEQFTLPANNVFVLSDEISDEVASIMDPLGNAVHTALSFDMLGEDVLITGAGPIGMMAAAIAKHAGARNIVVTDINPYRLQLAKKMGATRTVDVRHEQLESLFDELHMEEGFDVGLEMSGSAQGFTQMLQAMVPGGKVALLGILPPNTAIDWDLVIFKQLLIKGIWGREMFATWYKMRYLIQSGLDVSPVITHRFHIDDFQKGFDIMLSGEGAKVILDW